MEKELSRTSLSTSTIIRPPPVSAAVQSMDSAPRAWNMERSAVCIHLILSNALTTFAVCGDAGDIGPDVEIVPDSKCAQTCSGDPTKICGDGNLISYYTWEGTPLHTWHYPTGIDAGRYEFLLGGVVIPLITTLNVNGKISFVSKWGTGPPNTTGVYEFDPYFDDSIKLAWREMHVKTDVFCGVGLVLPDKVGRQVVLGGWTGLSTESIRLYWPNGHNGKNSTNDWEENVDTLALQQGRWYPSALTMANGSILVVGGEDGPNGKPIPTVEILPKVRSPMYMDWLERTDPNNLYPFMTVLPGGGILIQYYNEARILDENTLDTVRILPKLPEAVNNDDSGRNYPLEGTMVTLPQHAPYDDALTVLVCGGSAPYGGSTIDNCVSAQPDIADVKWTIERMVSRLPNTDDEHYQLTSSSPRSVSCPAWPLFPMGHSSS